MALLGAAAIRVKLDAGDTVQSSLAKTAFGVIKVEHIEKDQRTCLELQDHDTNGMDAAAFFQPTTDRLAPFYITCVSE